MKFLMTTNGSSKFPQMGIDNEVFPISMEVDHKFQLRKKINDVRIEKFFCTVKPNILEDHWSRKSAFFGDGLVVFYHRRSDYCK